MTAAQKHKRPDGEAQDFEPRFRLQRIDEVELHRDPPQLIRGHLPREGLALIWGPPKCGKSYAATDMALHVALGWPWRGHGVQRGAVVYVACEGERGWGARLAAWRQEFLAHHDLAEQPVPFYLVLTRLDLIADRADLIACIRAQLGDASPVLVVVDTLNRSLAGSESSDEDMSAYVQATDALRDTFACTVALVHHCGHDATRPRGHTALIGAADAQIAVRRLANGTVQTQVEFLKDGDAGDTAHHALRQVEVDRDEDGEPITACVIETTEAPARPEHGRKLSKNEQTMLDVLAQAGPDGLTVEEWNEQARNDGLGLKRRADLTDFRNALKRKGCAHCHMERWYVTSL